MIFFISDGRLGNQFFQYSFLRSIAKDNEKIFVLNMRNFCESVDFGGQQFRFLNPGRCGLFLFKNLSKLFVLNFLVPTRLIGHLKQDRSEVAALPSFRNIKGIFPITYVETNFFQSEKFFNKEDVDFKIKEIYLKKAKAFLTRVPKGSTKVFVHVRRGDYLYENFLGKTGINLPKSYFYSAINQIRSEAKEPYFIFLSDDSEYVECCFKDISHKIVSKNDMVTDLAIMTQCEYGVVSNSSFSWWGAYLMKKRRKVIFPKYWYGWKAGVEHPVGIHPSWGTVIDVDNKTELGS